MYFVIFCMDKPDSAKIREDTLETHVAYVNANRDKIVWAGARQNEDDKVPYGSFFILNVPDRAAAAAFSAADPFTRADLFERVEISNVRRGVFQPKLADQPD